MGYQTLDSEYNIILTIGYSFANINFLLTIKAYEFIPNNVETDSGNGGYIWEWCDENIHSNNDIELIKALSNAKLQK